MGKTEEYGNSDPLLYGHEKYGYTMINMCGGRKWKSKYILDQGYQFFPVLSL